MGMPLLPVAEPEEMWQEIAPIPGLPALPLRRGAWWWVGMVAGCALAFGVPLLMLIGHFAA